MKIAFLFGAGVSIPSGMDTTQDLTEKILRGENVVQLSGIYSPVEDPDRFNWDHKNEYISRIKRLFHVSKNYFENHYSFYEREMNYEDYYYLFDSMHTDENMEYENPLVTFFSDHLFKVHSSLFEPIEEYLAPLRLIDLMAEVKNYIMDLVAFNLNKIPEDLSQFEILNEIYNDKNYSNAYIFTVNHDTLIEQYLRKNKIEYSDGFVRIDESVKMWNPEFYKDKINLFKLHGSIDWSHYDSNDPYKKKVCIYIIPPRDISRPVIIIGSFNKLSEYSRGINFDLQFLFAKYLNECSRLVISGYSFGDQGINSRIINWLYGSRDRKITLIHKNEDELFQSARPAIRTIRHWDINEKTDLIRIIPKWFQECNWQEIKESIGQS